MSQENFTQESEQDNLDRLADELTSRGVDPDDAWDFLHLAKQIPDGFDRTFTLLNHSVKFRRRGGVLNILDPEVTGDEHPFGT